MIRCGEPPYLECSTKGVKFLSPFNAKVNGRSIEEQYQACKRFEDGTTGLGWREAKGRKAVNQEECNSLYSRLWDQYIAEHPSYLVVIKRASGLSDMFGQEGSPCQAKELWRIRNQ